MQRLPAAFEPLAEYNQFILWKPVQTPKRVEKKPVDPHTLRVHGAPDPEIWVSAEEAIAIAARNPGHGVGFVFTKDDPFFFLDLDHHFHDGAWSDGAMRLCRAFNGAAVEVSQGKDGLHIIARGDPGPHSNKNHEIGAELYSHGRFCALTGTHARGSVDADLTDAVRDLAARYFPPSSGRDLEDWTDEPVSEWAGPADDDELIRRALKARTGAAVFGGGVTFSDLWERNVEALGTKWPDPPREFDESYADSALAMSLSFWTGGNCERILRLMWKSKLVRSKWEDREDNYLKPTITRAVASCKNFYRERAADAEPDTGEAPVDAPRLVEGYQFLGAEAQVEHFAGCVYVQSIHRVLVPGGWLLNTDRFNATYGGYEFLREEGGKTTRKAWEAFTESQIIRWPKVNNLCFRPELPPAAIIEEEGARLVNSYAPITVDARPGDATPFLRHLEILLPDAGDRRILMAYMAACVQHPGVKFQWCPLIQGVEGNGKTLFTRCVAYAVGFRYFHPVNPQDIGNKFNAWLDQKLFVGVEDIYIPEKRREVIEALKPIITNDKIEIQAKGADQRMGDNRANFILNSNHRDAIRKTRNDRRFAVFFTAQQEASHIARDGLEGNYFPELYEWLRTEGYAVVAHMLQTYPIPDELNPATRCHRAPETSSTEEAIRAGLGGVEQEILEAVDEGRPGFAGGWISSMALNALLVKLRVERAITPVKRLELMDSLGYEYHPGLPGGRACKTILLDGGKPRLFIHRDSPARALVSPSDITRVYEETQNAADAEIVERLLDTGAS